MPTTRCIPSVVSAPCVRLRLRSSPLTRPARDGCDDGIGTRGVLQKIVRFGLRPASNTGLGLSRAAVMSGDLVLAACVTLGVLGYLVYALIRPERF